jgi:hypothetical protein
LFHRAPDYPGSRTQFAVEVKQLLRRMRSPKKYRSPSRKGGILPDSEQSKAGQD